MSPNASVVATQNVTVKITPNDKGNRQIYGSRLLIEGNRSLIFRNDAPLPEPELRHCIGLALTYHRRKRSRSAAKA